MLANCQRQFKGIQGVGTAIADMDDMTKENAGLVVQLAAASREMSGQASDIRTSLEFFRSTNESANDSVAVNGDSMLPKGTRQIADTF